eukprot:726573-Rhodomonas_salina.2
MEGDVEGTLAGTSLRASYAMSATDLAYAATPCQVLTERTLLRPRVRCYAMSAYGATLMCGTDRAMALRRRHAAAARCRAGQPLCSYPMLLLYAPNLCSYSMFPLYAPTLCSYSMLLFSPYAPATTPCPISLRACYALFYLPTPLLRPIPAAYARATPCPVRC